jgi:hypothetical protein
LIVYCRAECGFLVFGGDACRSMLKFEYVQSGPVYSEGGGAGKAALASEVFGLEANLHRDC